MPVGHLCSHTAYFPYSGKVPLSYMINPCSSCAVTTHQCCVEKKNRLRKQGRLRTGECGDTCTDPPWGLQQPADGGSVPRLDSWGSTIVQGPFIGRVSVCFVLRSVRLLSPPSRDPPALFCRDLQNGAVGKPSPSTPLTAELCVRCVLGVSVRCVFITQRHSCLHPAVSSCQSFQTHFYKTYLSVFVNAQPCVCVCGGRTADTSAFFHPGVNGRKQSTLEAVFH